MRTLLVAVDGSASGQRAVAHALETARSSADIKLLLLNVQQTLERWHAGGLLNEQARAHLSEMGREDLAQALRMVDEARVSYECQVQFGDPPEVISRLARERGCIGIVMGTRGLGDWANVFLGSTAYKVVQLADVPVTLVH